MQEQDISSIIRQQQSQEPQLSAQTRERIEATKLYIENKYAKRKQRDQDRKQNWEKLDEKMKELELNDDQRDLIKKDIKAQEADQMRRKRQKISSKDFIPLAIIGRGAFGEVRVCRHYKTKEIVAIKKMKKSDMINKNQLGHVNAERNFLVSADNPWIVGLKYSFQDERYLYLVMEYVPGGDLMTLLMKKDILPENEAKFYIAETILAVQSVHKMNYIHRDLKPDNILIDKEGHIKLSDFGLCKLTEIKPKIDFGKKDPNGNEPPPPNEILTNLHHINKKNFKNRDRKLAFSTVGTPDYIAPEVFGQKGYTETVDWWSVGVILYEMLVGYPPFFSEDPGMTCKKILHWRKTLKVPPEANLSLAAVDLIKRLITDPSERLGINGTAEIKAHPFFAGIEWKNIRNKEAPIRPEIKSEIDVSNFDKYDEEEPWIIQEPNLKKNKKNRKQDANFISFTFKRDIDQERDLLVQALENLEEKKIIFDQIGCNQKTVIESKTQSDYNSNSQTKSTNSTIQSSQQSTPQQHSHQQHQFHLQNNMNSSKENLKQKLFHSPHQQQQQYLSQQQQQQQQLPDHNNNNNSNGNNNNGVQQNQFQRQVQQNYQQAIQSLKKDNVFNPIYSQNSNNQYMQFSQYHQNHGFSIQPNNHRNNDNQQHFSQHLPQTNFRNSQQQPLSQSTQKLDSSKNLNTLQQKSKQYQQQQQPSQQNKQKFLQNNNNSNSTQNLNKLQQSNNNNSNSSHNLQKQIQNKNYLQQSQQQQNGQYDNQYQSQPQNQQFNTNNNMNSRYANINLNMNTNNNNYNRNNNPVQQRQSNYESGNQQQQEMQYQNQMKDNLLRSQGGFSGSNLKSNATGTLKGNKQMAMGGNKY